MRKITATNFRGNARCEASATRTRLVAPIAYLRVGPGAAIVGHSARIGRTIGIGVVTAIGVWAVLSVRNAIGVWAVLSIPEAIVMAVVVRRACAVVAPEGGIVVPVPVIGIKLGSLLFQALCLGALAFRLGRARLSLPLGFGGAKLRFRTLAPSCGRPLVGRCLRGLRLGR